MAAAGGSRGPGGGGREPFKGFPPKSPKFVPRSDNEEPLPPDTEDHVCQQTEGIFKNFMYQRLQDDQLKSPGDLETPFVPELTSFTDSPISPNAQIGRRLALIGDDINRKYEHEFKEMIQTLRITPDTAYEAFAGVARNVTEARYVRQQRLFIDGRINWGRIITLLCFGYRMAIETLHRGFRSFVQKIVQFVVKFIAVEKIAKWIAEQGGWAAALRYVPETVGIPAFMGMLCFAIAAVGVWYYFKKK